MKFDAAFTSRLEKLARLSLNDEERELLATDLTKIVAMIDKLNTLDAKKVEPLIWMLENDTTERPDKVQGQLSRAEALHNAPEHDEQFFRVKKFLK
jgi:aspartyl-tRNA(Asn)/glutamyl-tRNA(Gln) amidotransferase subunit C